LQAWAERWAARERKAAAAAEAAADRDR